MVVTANDFVFLGCANHAENDSDTQGGAIDKGKLVVMFGLEMSGADQLQMECNVSITGVYVITGRSNLGAIITDTYTFAAETGPITGASGTVFSRILKVVKSSGTIPSNAVIGFHELTSGINRGYLYGSGRSPSGSEITEVRRLFIGATRPGVTSPPTIKNLYEKFFIYNGHATDTMSAGYIKKTLDPASLCAFDLEDSLDGTESTTNRITAPTNVLGIFDSLDKIIQDVSSPSIGSLGAGEGQGIWVRLRLTHLTGAGVGQVNFMADGQGL